MTRLRRLVSRRSARDAERVFVAEGARVVDAALAAHVSIEALYLDAEAELSKKELELVETARARGIRVFLLAQGVMARVADTVTPQPILAVVNYLDQTLVDVADGTLVVLVDVRDPGNIGAILRSADAAGIDAVVCCDGCGDLYNPKTVRASAGSLFSVPIVRGGEPAETLDTLAQRGFNTVAMVARDGQDYATANLDGPLALIFGNEAKGLDAATVARCRDAMTIPIAGGAESLNVAMAATVICFELARRRRHGGREAFSMNS